MFNLWSLYFIDLKKIFEIFFLWSCNIKYHNIITLTSSQNSAFKQMLSYSIGCDNMPKEMCIYILNYFIVYFISCVLN